MEGMAEERRRLAELREEKRRLKQSDIQDNVQRSMRAMQYRNEDLKAKFAMEDERELARRAGKAQLVEEGVTFRSQTDTEVIAQLIGHLMHGTVCGARCVLRRRVCRASGVASRTVWAPFGRVI